MIVIAENLVLAATPETNANNPLIGWQNLVTAGNVAADLAEAGFPASNLGNPATNLVWKGQGLDSATKLLLHCDGIDGATIFANASSFAHAVTVSGNAQVDTAQSKFGGAAALFDGTGDFLDLDGHADFAFGAAGAGGLGDFTVDFWFRLNAVGVLHYLYDSRPAATDGFYPTLYVAANNTLRYFTNAADRIVGATALTAGVWNHCALVRAGVTTKLFLNGVQQGATYFDAGTYLVGATRPRLGALGTTGASGLNGWLDEVRVSKGAARWTTTFTPPLAAYNSGDQHVTVTLDGLKPVDYCAVARHNLGSGQVPVTVQGSTTPGVWFDLVGQVLLGTDDPVIFRFVETHLIALRLKLGVGTKVPSAAVLYVGKLLVLQRRLYVGHTPLPYGRSCTIANGRSESGNFLGRIVLGQMTETSVALQNLTPAFYRAQLDPFVVAAKDTPFFFAWRPAAYPLEVGYAWCTNDPKPQNQRSNGMMSLSFDLGGILR